MSLPGFATQVLTVLRAPTVNDHGTQVPDWANAAPHTVTGCSVQPATGSENLANRDSVVTAWTVFAPLDADIRPTDRVQFDGHLCEVDGPVRRWATGVLDHAQLFLRAVEG